MRAYEPPPADECGYDDIIAKIRDRAPGYAPEWRFDPEGSDAGSALARVFARLLAGSAERFAKTPRNHKTAFLNLHGAARRPARPAFGYVCFSLILPDAGGVLVPPDFKLFSPPDDSGARCGFETRRSVFVTPARILHVAYADPKADRLLFGGEGETSIDTVRGGNISCHELGMRHEFIELAHPGSKLLLSIRGQNAERLKRLMCDPSKTEWRAEGGSGVIALDAGEDGIMLNGADGAEYVTLSPCDKEILKQQAPEELLLTLAADNVLPDAVYAGGEERESDTRFAAFGEEFSVHSAMCVLCDDALKQAGALITVNFRLDFSERMLGDIPELKLPSKLVVPKREHMPVKRQDIIIEDAVWEYFNGTGFAPLKTLSPVSGMFCGLDAGGGLKPSHECRIQFICPGDMSPFIAGSKEGLCLRVRLRSVLGIYERPARLIVPHVSAVRFSYRYQKERPVTDFTVLEGGETYKLDKLPKLLFEGLPEGLPSLYFMFDRPLPEKPVSMLIDIPEDAEETETGEISWMSMEKGEWRRLKVRDETDGFKETGTVEFEARPDMASLFGKRGFWIKASFAKECGVTINGVYLNAAPVVQCESSECFTGDTEVRVLRLPGGNILDAGVAVNRAERGEDPERWEDLEENAFHLDGAEGQLLFEPPLRPASAGRTVKVRYRRGGGLKGNLPAGEIFTPALMLGNIHSAINPAPLWGGAEAETEEEAENRTSCEIRHGGRPVTAEDIEDILMDSGQALVRCVTEPEGGLSVVILPSGKDAPFGPVRKRACETLLPLLPLGIGKIRVLKPVLIHVSVSAELELLPGTAELMEAEETIFRLCDPVWYGNHRGLGRLPDAREISETLLALRSVVACYKLMVRYHRRGHEIDVIPRFALPAPGTISIEGRPSVCLT